MAKTKKALHETIRNHFLENITEYLTAQKGEEVLKVKSNQIAIPTLDEEGNDEWCVITFTVPTGSREDNEGFDGYGMAQQYAEATAEKERKAEEAKAEKARKIARDKAQREARAKAKAEHEKGE